LFLVDSYLKILWMFRSTAASPARDGGF